MSFKCGSCGGFGKRLPVCDLCKLSFHADCDVVKLSRVGRSFLKFCSNCRRNRSSDIVTEDPSAVRNFSCGPLGKSLLSFDLMPDTTEMDTGEKTSTGRDIEFIKSPKIDIQLFTAS